MKGYVLYALSQSKYSIMHFANSKLSCLSYVCLPAWFFQLHIFPILFKHKFECSESDIYLWYDEICLTLLQPQQMIVCIKYQAALKWQVMKMRKLHFKW